MNTCKVPSILFADTVDPNTYQKILESWFRCIQANNPSLTKTTTLANYITQLAQFHAALNTNSNAKNLPRIGRSFNRLFSALGVLCNAENRKQLIIFREVIRDKYLDNGIIDKEHRRVMEEIFNEMFPISEGYN